MTVGRGSSWVNIYYVVICLLLQRAATSVCLIGCDPLCALQCFLFCLKIKTEITFEWKMVPGELKMFPFCKIQRFTTRDTPRKFIATTTVRGWIYECMFSLSSDTNIFTYFFVALLFADIFATINITSLEERLAFCHTGVHLTVCNRTCRRWLTCAVNCTKPSWGYERCWSAFTACLFIYICCRFFSVLAMVAAEAMATLAKWVAVVSLVPPRYYSGNVASL